MTREPIYRPALATIPLAREPLRSLLLQEFIFAFGFLVGLGFVAGAVALMVKVPLAGLLLLLVLGLPAVIASALGARQQWRQHTGGLIAIHEDRISIAHPGVVRSAIEIPRGQLRATFFADQQGGQIPAFVADLPYLGIDRQQPNLALIFDPKVPLPRLRRKTTHGPRKGEALAGLLVRVDDPAAARESLAMAHLLREPKDLDLTRLEDELRLRGIGAQQPRIHRRDVGDLVRAWFAGNLHPEDFKAAEIVSLFGVALLSVAFPPMGIFSADMGFGLRSAGRANVGTALAAISLCAVVAGLAYRIATVQDAVSWSIVGATVLIGLSVVTRAVSAPDDGSSRPF